MTASEKATAVTGLAKVLMPVPDPHPDVFDREWPLRVGDIDRVGLGGCGDERSDAKVVGAGFLGGASLLDCLG